MFTLEQIDTIHVRLGSANTLGAYLSALATIGINTYDSYIRDGHSEYHGNGDYVVVSSPTHETYIVAHLCDKKRFLEQLELHKKGATNYFQMSQGLAASGIEKWTFDTQRMTLTYYDTTGTAVYTEEIAS